MEKNLQFFYADGRSYRAVVALDTDGTTIVGVNLLKVYIGTRRSTLGNNVQAYSIIFPTDPGYNELVSHIINVIGSA